MTHKTLLATSAALGLAAVAAATSAQAQDSSGLELKFYGQINVGFATLDDGTNRQTAFTDNDNSNTRVGFLVGKELDNGAELKFQFETAVGATGSSSISPFSNSFEVEYRRTELRKFDFSYSSDSFGTLSIGQGSMASDGATGADLSGTGVASNASVSDIGAGVEFLTTAGVASGVEVGDVFGTFDGSRRLRIRYDTPEFNGLVGSIAYGQEVLSSGNDNEYFDVALNYERDYNDFTVAAGLGYSAWDNSNEQIGASLAAKHNPTGLSLAVATGQDLNGDASYGYAKVGIERDLFAFGSTAASVEYYKGSDFVTVGSASEMSGISLVQDIDKLNMEVYATYRQFEYSDPTNTFQDVEAVMVGTRWKF